MSSKRATCWCFTVNNPGAWRPLWQPEEMGYLCYELERGKEGTEHVQGYVRYKTRKTFAVAKHMIADTAHMEPAKGTEEHNKEYCSKEKNGSFVEHGTYEPTQGAKRQGQRSDLEGAFDQMKKGVPKQQVFASFPHLIAKYPSGMEKAYEVLRGPPPQVRDVHVTILWGPTGTGKSHRARTAFPDAYVCVPELVGTFDSYSGQEVIIMDEFEPQKLEISRWNSITDKWKYEIPCRYANKFARWTHVIVCSNIDPMTWWAVAPLQQRQAAQRRMVPPIGRIYQIDSMEQQVEMNWFAPLPMPLVPLAAPAPLDTPAGAGSSNQPAALKRTTHPSPTSSPSLEPPLSRQRLSGSNQSKVVVISDSSDSEESQSD